MRRLLLAALALSTALPCLAEAPLAVRAGRIHPISGPPISDGFILCRDGRIAALGPASEVVVPPGARVVALPEAWIVPGFVDSHSHVAGSDFNDSSHPVNPDLDVLDQLVPQNELLLDALHGGVTTLLYLPGSATNLGGFGALVKPAGRDLDEMILRFPGAMKIAQAGNPERYSGEIGATRMGMNWNIRRALEQGRDYHAAWTAWEEGSSELRPERVHRLEMMRGLFRREFPILVHTAWMDVVQQSMRMLSDEFGLDVVLSHGTFDGFQNAPLVAERGLPLDLGPRLFHVDYETGRVVGLAAAYSRAGVERLSINCDAPGVHQEEQSLQAAMSVRMGLPWELALRALTLVPAQSLGIADRVGSLEVGKDADFAAWSGDPLDPRSRVLLCVGNGRVVVDARTPDAERRF